MNSLSGSTTPSLTPSSTFTSTPTSPSTRKAAVAAESESPRGSRYESSSSSTTLTSNITAKIQKTTHVYVKDEKYGWVPAHMLSRLGTKAVVVLDPPKKSKPLRQQNQKFFNDNDRQQQHGFDFLAGVITSITGKHNDDDHDERGEESSEQLEGNEHEAEEEKKDAELVVVVDTNDGDRGIYSEHGSPKGGKKGHVNKIIGPCSPLPALSPPRTSTRSQPFTPLAATTLSYDDALSRPDTVTIDLQDYPSQTLPLQDVSDDDSQDYANGPKKLITHDDMCDIPYLHEASILYNLKGRYEGYNGVPYTRTGDIIVAINPYRWIKGLYAERTRQLYARQFVWRANPQARKQLPPHVYETSSLAFKGLVMDSQNQSILVSGESGAGKTVSVKILMSHLATFQDTKKDIYLDNHATKNTSHQNGQGGGISLSALTTLVNSFIKSIFNFAFSGNGHDSDRQHSSHHDDIMDIEAQNIELDDDPEELNQTNLIIQRVLDSNPLLEAFGNAKTSRNDNSSRFSKYVKLQFHVEYSGRAFPQCNIAGSRCETYLLEKCRVVNHESTREERTFHIFYQLLAAPEEYKVRLWERGLSKSDTSSFKYVGHNETDTIEGLTDSQRWRRTVAALNIVGIKGEKLSTLMRAVCVVLQLGNLVFDVDPKNEEGSIITSKDELDKLSDILGIPSDDISRALTFRTVTAVNEELKVPVNPVHAKDTCDAFAKEVYARTFDWLVRAINEATCATKNYYKDVEEFGVIGLLDIFGFESFETNHFEQICINHANERLQKKFTEDIFRSVQAEYESEGIDLCEVNFEDNSNVLRLMEGRLGLIDLLNEECLRPQGSDTGFVNKVYAQNSKVGTPLLKNKRYLRHEFGVQHYAGPVKYDANKFVMKNMDKLPQDVIDCALMTTNDLIREELRVRKEEKPLHKGSLVTQTVWTKFKDQLTSLMNDIGATRTWYVRCINPNTKKEAGVIDLKYTLSQLRHAGLVSAVTISRAAFPNRLSFSQTLERFRFLATHAFLKASNIRAVDRFAGKSNVEVLLDHFLRTMGADCETYERRSVDVLLDHLLKSIEVVSPTGEVKRAYVCGKTRVYFRAGALEFLESQRILAYDRCATVIQTRVRRNAAVARYDAMRKNPPPRHLQRRDSIHALIMTVLIDANPFLPVSLMLWRQITGLPFWILHRPRSGGRE